MNDNARPDYTGQAADLGFCEELVTAIELAEAAFRRGDRVGGLGHLINADKKLHHAVRVVIA
jgi:hypothetical protein